MLVIEVPITPQVDEEQLWEALSRLIPNSEIVVDGVIFTGNSEVEGVSSVTSEEIAEINETLSRAVLIKESGIVWPDRAEFLLTILSDAVVFDRFLAEKEFRGEGENALTYRVSRGSKEFAAYLLCKMMGEGADLRKSRWMLIRRRVQSTLVRASRESRFAESSLLDIVADCLFATTLQIESPVRRGDFESLANSFLFQAAYNLDVSARLSHSLEHLLRGTRIQRVRRADREAFDAPRQTYDPDLIHHYLMGVAGGLPLLQYLAFYHIAEHYFEKVFNDELVRQVRATITDPAFSIRRSKDVQRVIKVVNKSQRQIREEGGVNEQRALELVIEKFVNVDRLISDIEAYDDQLIDYYRDNIVSFADAGKVDLRQEDQSNIPLAIAKRVYKVRNALVHAKDGSLPKYTPFAHDADLLLEVPLARFLAEQIAVAHARPI
ncbi:hypothetical protein ACIBI3_43510 [Actinomadura luteofluorescens]|uniref:hypothetical protein n=1 Tax=Actinomadura luteofluorescens TaxID=46163 RepID=UPI00346EA4E8